MAKAIDTKATAQKIAELEQDLIANESAADELRTAGAGMIANGVRSLDAVIADMVRLRDEAASLRTQLAIAREAMALARQSEAQVNAIEGYDRALVCIAEWERASDDTIAVVEKLRTKVERLKAIAANAPRHHAATLRVLSTRAGNLDMALQDIDRCLKPVRPDIFGRKWDEP